MNLVRKHRGEVKKGKVVLDDRYAYIRDLAHLEGKRVEVIVQLQRKGRTDNQNAYYWGVVVGLLSDHTGYTTDEMHEALKWQFLRVPGDDGLPDRVKETKALSTVEFSEYIESVKRWAAEKFQVYIPDSGEAYQ